MPSPPHSTKKRSYSTPLYSSALSLPLASSRGLAAWQIASSHDQKRRPLRSSLPKEQQHISIIITTTLTVMLTFIVTVIVVITHPRPQQRTRQTGGVATRTNVYKRLNVFCFTTGTAQRSPLITVGLLASHVQGTW